MKKAGSQTVKRTTLTNQLMHSKFLIAFGSALLLFSQYVKGGIAWAHAYPAVSIPSNGATVKEPPREVRIQFTEGVEIAFSRITVKGVNGEVVSQGKVRQLAEDTLAIDLKPLSPGNYTVEWQVLSVDTHVTEGLLHFTIEAARK
jgi:methionine-rich copper-binding protein CopC